MKKSSYVAMVPGAFSLFLFAIGTCMTLVPELNAFTPGVVFGCLGIISATVTLTIWRKMENKAPISLSPKTILGTVIGLAGALLLGLGTCFHMLWSQMIVGAFIGLLGITALRSLFPFFMGIRD